MVGSTGNARNVAAINAMVDAVEGIVGPRAMVEVNEALAARGLLTEMPAPDYGYVRSRLTLHERLGCNLYNDWVGGNLNELPYTDRQGRYDRTGSFICRQTPDQRCARRYRMRYTRGVEVNGDMWDRPAELQIDKVAVRKDIPTNQLGDEEISGDLRAQLRGGR